MPAAKRSPNDNSACSAFRDNDINRSPKKSAKVSCAKKSMLSQPVSVPRSTIYRINVCYWSIPPFCCAERKAIHFDAASHGATQRKMVLLAHSRDCSGDPNSARRIPGRWFLRQNRHKTRNRPSDRPAHPCLVPARPYGGRSGGWRQRCRRSGPCPHNRGVGGHSAEVEGSAESEDGVFRQRRTLRNGRYPLRPRGNVRRVPRSRRIDDRRPWLELRVAAHRHDLPVRIRIADVQTDARAKQLDPSVPGNIATNSRPLDGPDCRVTVTTLLWSTFTVADSFSRNEILRRRDRLPTPALQLCLENVRLCGARLLHLDAELGSQIVHDGGGSADGE